MKCVCGYEYNTKYENGKEILIGDEEFIPSKNSLTYRADKDLCNKTIFICPKCGTLKIDI